MNNLQMLRKAAGLSQSKLAERSGVNFRTLQHFELIPNEELANRRAADVLALCNAMNCSVSELIETDAAHDYDQRIKIS